MFILFLIVPISVGAGIAIKRKHDNQKKSGDEITGLGTADTVPSGNGLSYGDWYCADCRCYTDQEALNKCLQGINSKR